MAKPKKPPPIENAEHERVLDALSEFIEHHLSDAAPDAIYRAASALRDIYRDRVAA